MSKKIRFFDVVRIVLLLFFVGVLFYPTISDYLSRVNSSYVISSYNEELEELDDTKRNEMLEEARLYNATLNQNVEFYDPFSDVEDVNSTYMSLLNASSNSMMGFIQIPVIDVKLPIYHTVKESVLQKGVGHMEMSSLPVGGENTHAVLTGHRGLPSSLLFTDLDKMVVGDIFYIEVLGETLAYQVDQIKTVLPSEIKDIQIVKGEDFVTLVTCTPYSVNTHRLLVRGRRIDYEQAILEVENVVENGIHLPFEVQVLMVVLPILVILLFWMRRKKDENK